MIDFLVKKFIPRWQEIQDPAVRRRYGALSGLVGIALNLCLFLGKFLSGLLTASIAVTADAFNNLSDAGSSVVTLVGFRLAGQQADEGHPFGHGRAEYLSGLLVSLIILLVGAELAVNSVKKLFHPEAVAFSWVTCAILLASICVKLWMFWFNRGLSKRIGSAAIAATAADSLSDVAATAVVLLSTLLNRFVQVNIDGAAGILVAVFILRAGLGAAKETLDPLLGRPPDPDLVAAIRKDILSHPEILGIHDMVLHDYGPGRMFMSLHAEVSCQSDIMTVHDAIDAIEQEIKARYQIQTVIHMDPIATDEATTALRGKIADLVREIDPRLTIHDFRMTAGTRRTNLIFDVAAPFHLSMTDAELKARIQQKASALSETYFTVVEVDHSYTAQHQER